LVSVGIINRLLEYRFRILDRWSPRQPLEPALKDLDDFGQLVDVDS